MPNQQDFQLSFPHEKREKGKKRLGINDLILSCPWKWSDKSHYNLPPSQSTLNVFIIPNLFITQKWEKLSFQPLIHKYTEYG